MSQNSTIELPKVAPGGLEPCETPLPEVIQVNIFSSNFSLKQKKKLLNWWKLFENYFSFVDWICAQTGTHSPDDWRQRRRRRWRRRWRHSRTDHDCRRNGGLSNVKRRHIFHHIFSFFFFFFCIFFIYRRLNGQAPVMSNSIRRKDRLIRSSRMISVTRKVSCFFLFFFICF